MKKTITDKNVVPNKNLRVRKEVIRELRNPDLKEVKGGVVDLTRSDP